MYGSYFIIPGGNGSVENVVLCGLLPAAGKPVGQGDGRAGEHWHGQTIPKRHNPYFIRII